MDLESLKNPNYHMVLFTGGLDSTYRICQLAIDKNAIIQPVYILFPDNKNSHHVRPELQNEIDAQDKILEYIKTQPQTKATILPIRRVHRDELPVNDKEVLYACNVDDWEGKLASVGGLGWQYYYFAIYAKYYPGVELCQERVFRVFTKHNVIFKVNELGQNRAYFDLSGNKKYLFLQFIFGNLSFPIIGTTREQMQINLKKWGYTKVWELIVFCYKTIHNKPCGVCDNCFAKINEGLDFLFTRDAIHRYYVLKVIRRIDIFNKNKNIQSLYHNYVTNGKLFDDDIDNFVIRLSYVHFFEYLEKMSDKTLKKLVKNDKNIFDIYHKLVLRKGENK